MLKYAVKCVNIMLKYALLPTICKILLMVLTACMVPLSLLFMQNLIDSIIVAVSGDGSTMPIVLWTGLLVLAMMLSNSNNFANSIIWISMQRKLAVKFARDIVEKYKAVDYPCFEDATIIDTLDRMGDNPEEKVLSFFTEILRVVEGIIIIIGTLIMFTQVEWWISAAFGVLMVVKSLLSYKGLKIEELAWCGQAADERKMKYYAHIMSEKHSLYELKVFGGLGYVGRVWKAKTEDVLTEKIRANIKAYVFYAASTFLELAWIASVIFILINGVSTGDISIGLLTALIGAVGSVSVSSNSLSIGFKEMSETYMRMKHYETFMALPQVIDNDNVDKIISPCIVFEDVHFSYPKSDIEILRGISFEIKDGESIALVGENGAGKSTIIKLLCRLYSPNSGRILVNGTDISELSIAQLRGLISVVFQDYINYQLTLRENVAFGNIAKMSDDKAIEEVLGHLFSDGFGKDIDINLGKIEEDGIDLSGGQWQRIAIARAYLSDSSFLVLDEPTASIDPVAESEMYHSFAKVLEDKGSILISHRLASAKIVDRIIVITDGVVSEQGTHDELIGSDGLYSRMWDAQSSWYKGGDTHEEEV